MLAPFIYSLSLLKSYPYSEIPLARKSPWRRSNDPLTDYVGAGYAPIL